MDLALHALYIRGQSECKFKTAHSPGQFCSPKKAKQKRVKDEIHKFKEGTLYSGSKKGSKVTDRKQAIAIALTEAGFSKKDKKRTAKNKAKE